LFNIVGKLIPFLQTQYKKLLNLHLRMDDGPKNQRRKENSSSRHFLNQIEDFFYNMVVKEEISSSTMSSNYKLIVKCAILNQKTKLKERDRKGFEPCLTCF
jgi:hypothetical protein